MSIPRRTTLILLALVGLTAVGVVWRLQKPAAVGPTAGHSPCTLVPRGEGQLLTYLGDQVPVRGFAWAETLDPLTRYLQVVTQNDHQLLFKVEGPSVAKPLQVERPGDVPEAFFRFARLHRALRLSDGSLLLHYVSEGFTDLPSLLIHTAPDTGRAMWHQRLAGDRSRLQSHGSSHTLLVFGPRAPITKAQLVPGKTPVMQTLERPADMDALLDLCLVGTRLLASHAKGLSIWTSEGGWSTSLPIPASELTFTESRGRLCLIQGRPFWQPRPGTLFEVAWDEGAPSLRPMPFPELPTASTLDRALLHLIDADPGGNLWFDLARPSAPATTAVSAPLALPEAKPAVSPSHEGLWKDEAAPAPVLSQEADLKAHLKGPLDRIYAWPIRSRQMVSISLRPLAPGLGVPAELQAGGLRLLPSQGLAASAEPNPAWWTPLERLLRAASAPQPK